MVKPHSMDLREHAMQRLATGETTYQVAAALNVAVSSVIKWAQKQKKSGSVEPGKMGGHKPFIIDGEHKASILNHIKKAPGASLGDLVQLLDKRGLKVHSSSVSRFLVREGIKLKEAVHLKAIKNLNVQANSKEGTQMKKDQQMNMKPSELKPSELKLSELKPSELKPSELKPSELKPNELKPVELKLVQKTQPEPVAALKIAAESSVKIQPKVEIKSNQLDLVQPEQKAKDKVQRKAYQKIMSAPKIEMKSSDTPVHAIEPKEDVELLLDVPQQNSVMPQITFFEIDINAPVKPVIEGLKVLETVFKCRKEFYQTCFNSWTDMYLLAFKR